MARIHPRFGFHTGTPGKLNGIKSNYFQPLHDAGLPANCKGVDSMAGVFDLQELAQQNPEIGHLCMWRPSTVGQNDRYDYDVPRMDLPPFDSAVIHWSKIQAIIPSDLDKTITWIEGCNEVRAEINPDNAMWNGLHPVDYWGLWSIEFCKLAISQGYKSAVPSWNNGEPPNPAYFELSGQLAWFRYLETEPRALQTIHEYNFFHEDFLDIYPYTYGRFQAMMTACDNHGIIRPKFYISESGWSLNLCPSPEQAIPFLHDATMMYAHFADQWLGSALWGLNNYQGVQESCQLLIAPVGTWTLNNSYDTGDNPNTRTASIDTYGGTVPGDEPVEPPPEGSFKAVSFKIGQEHTRDEWRELSGIAFGDYKRSMTASSDACIREVMAGRREDSYAIIVDPDLPSQVETIEMLESAGLSWIAFNFRNTPPEPPPSVSGIDNPVGDTFAVECDPANIETWPCDWVDANPYGSTYTLNGRQTTHTGSDLNNNNPWDADKFAPVYAPGDGEVIQAMTFDPSSTWGNVIILKNNVDGFGTIYTRHAHLNKMLVTKGEHVERGQIIGEIGDAFGKLAYHLHYDISPTDKLSNSPGDWPGSDMTRITTDYVDPKYFTMFSRPGMIWPERERWVVVRSVNLRVGPSANRTVIEVVSGGVEFYRLNGPISNYVFLKLDDGRYGWIHEDFIEKAGTQPPPTDPEKVNVLNFIRGENLQQFDQEYEIQGGGSGTQTTMIRHLSVVEWLYVKGTHGEYEHFWVQEWQGEDWIFRADDTSESPERMYAQYMSQDGPLGAPWIPVEMEVGKVYNTNKFVQHYLKAGCVPQNSGNVTDSIHLTRTPYERTYESGKTEMVITLQWSGGEEYDFAEAGGNIAFRDTNRNFWFMGWLDGRDPLDYIKHACFGW